LQHGIVAFSTALAVALALGHSEAAGDTPASGQPLESVTITASRIIRDGYEAPTPTTVLGADVLTLRAPETLANALSHLPQMRNAADEGTASLFFGGAAGRGFVNLRGLGTNRTLVLLDGERPVSNSLSGDRDILSLPSALIARVDVVTGGASASHGSDAIAGVVNFVIDSRFSGFRASAEGGVSSQSDAGTRKITAAWGGGGERWHLIASAEGFERDGLSSGSRSFATPHAIVPRPGELPLLVVRNAYDADQAPGGLILNGPLAGQQFLADGTTAPYVPSSCSVSQPYVLCDSRQDLAATLGAIALTAPQRRATGFGRLTFQITPDLEARFDALVTRNRTSLTSIPLETSEFGLQLGIDVAQNPFLPEAVRSQYLAAGEPTLFLGRQNTDEGIFEDVFRESVESFSAGLRARLGGTWLLNTRASYGQANTGERWQNAYSINRFFDAVDAVSAGGTVTCRTTDPACAPANIFGSGNMSADAKAYFLGTIRKPLKTSLRELGLDVTGVPLSLWAGPVSVAAGATYREEYARQFNDGVNGGFAFSGYPAFSGEIRVSEAYAQTVVPLISDRAFAKSVEADLAVRAVRYSQAGSEMPWKLGLNWVPFEGLRLRATASEDIRAPNVLELNLPQFPSSISPQVNPLPDGLPVFNSLGVAPGQTLNVREIGGGNPALTPEVARTTAVGLALQPTKLPGFSASLDYFHIKIRDAITTLPASTIVRGCAAGDESQCELIAMPAGATLPTVATVSLNAQSFITSGIDGEVSYRFALAGGEATIRALANYMLEYEQIAPGAAALELRGDISLGLPALQGDLSFQFTRGGTTALISGVYIGSGAYRKTMSAEIQNNHVPHVWYADATVEQQLKVLCAGCSAYAAVSNLFDQEPPHPGFGIYTNIESPFLTGVPYDRIGRYFKVGVRTSL
jgi:iron complex outermembrane receptor protein